MNFEDLEQMRYENTKKVMDEMAAVTCDRTIDIKDRLTAAKIVDGMSDSIIRAYLMRDMSDTAKDANKNNRRLLNQLDKLKDHDND